MSGRFWPEVWTRPGSATFQRAVDDRITRLDYTARFGVGNGTIGLPADENLDAYILRDPDTPANDVRRLVRLYEADAGVVAEFFLDLIADEYQETGERQIGGPAIDSAWGDARVESWDWDGTDTHTTINPDWIYGGANQLQNPGFEDQTAHPSTWNVWNDGSGGTWQLQIDTTTAAIAWNASAATVAAAIEALAEIIVCNVTGSGTVADPWHLEFADPAVIESPVLLDAVTGGTSRIARSNTDEINGGLGYYSPVGWTVSQQVQGSAARVHGAYQQFELVTTPVHSGTSALKIDPANENGFPGVQQIVSVQPGMVYQASIWVRPTDATDDFRFVVRTLDETFIASDTGDLGFTSYAANTWSQVTISNIVIPEGVTQVIFRFANVTVTPGAQSIFYVDDAELNIGMPPATLGVILGDLYDDATTDHAPGRVVWAKSGGGVWLTLDFSDTLDSSGAAWDAELSYTVRHRQNYLQIMAEFEELGGYEWRIVPDTPGDWLLQVYNPTGMDDAPAVTIQSGSGTLGGPLGTTHAPGNDVMIEGIAGLTSRFRDTTHIGAVGRREYGEFIREATAQDTVDQAAAAQLVDFLESGLSVAFTYEPQDGHPVPLLDWRVGDTIGVAHPPRHPLTNRRTSAVQLSWTPDTVQFRLSFLSELFTGQAAVAEGVRRLLLRLDRLGDTALPEAPIIPGGGGEPTVVVASSEATALSMSKADFICTGFNDEVIIQQAIDLCAGAGKVRLTEGPFYCEVPDVGVAIDVPAGVWLQGESGNGATIISSSNAGTVDSILVRVECGQISDLELEATDDIIVLVLGDCGT